MRRCWSRGACTGVPTVTVHIERRPTNNITVVGAVKTPGTQQVPRSASYLGTVIVAAGGFTEKAGTKVQITRLNREPRIVEVDLADENQRPVAAQYLDDGDVVTVEKRELPPVQVQGLVLKPGEIEFPANQSFRITNAISAAGGESNDLADSILIQRQRPDGQGVVLIRASLAEAMQNGQENLVLAPGDTVRVERTPATFFWEGIKRIGVGIGGTLPLVPVTPCCPGEDITPWSNPSPNRRARNRPSRPILSRPCMRFAPRGALPQGSRAGGAGRCRRAGRTVLRQHGQDLSDPRPNCSSSSRPTLSKEINIPGMSREAQDYMDTYRSVILSEAVLEPALSSLSPESRIDFQNVRRGETRRQAPEELAGRRSSARRASWRSATARASRRPPRPWSTPC